MQQPDENKRTPFGEMLEDGNYVCHWEETEGSVYQVRGNMAQEPMLVAQASTATLVLTGTRRNRNRLSGDGAIVILV